MNFSSLLAGGAIFGFVAATWGKIKFVVWKILNCFIQKVEIANIDLQNALLNHIMVSEDFKLSFSYDRLYSSTNAPVGSIFYKQLPYEMIGQKTLIIWYKNKYPIIFSRQQEKSDRDKSGPNSEAAEAAFGKSPASGVNFIFIKGTIDFEKLLKEACEYADKKRDARVEEYSKRRFAIYTCPSKDELTFNRCDFGYLRNDDTLKFIGVDRNKIGFTSNEDNACKALDQLIFPPNIKELIKEIELWKNNEEWFAKKHIPWKRGWCLYGPPGTGKTALARAFAQDLDMPIFVFDLAQMDNKTFVAEWQRAQRNYPCIVLIEDIDNVFKGRENIARYNHTYDIISSLRPRFSRGGGQGTDSSDDIERPRGVLNFDVFLNCLDGIVKSEGVFTIITTNNIDSIDEALGKPRKMEDGRVEFISTRPGRLDKAIELGYLDLNGKTIMAKRILGEYKEEYHKMLRFIENHPDLEETPAQFQERCAQIALKCFWQSTIHKGNGHVHKERSPQTVS